MIMADNIWISSDCLPGILLRVEWTQWSFCNTEGGIKHMHRIIKDSFSSCVIFFCVVRFTHMYFSMYMFSYFRRCLSFLICFMMIIVLFSFEYLLPQRKLLIHRHVHKGTHPHPQMAKLPNTPQVHGGSAS